MFKGNLSRSDSIVKIGGTGNGNRGVWLLVGRVDTMLSRSTGYRSSIDDIVELLKEKKISLAMLNMHFDEHEAMTVRGARK